MSDKILHFSKVTAHDGEWRADLYPIKNNAFAKWGIRYYKASPIGWVETGTEDRWHSRKVAVASLIKNGYTAVVS